MKFFGVIFLLGALGLGVAWPWAQLNFLGSEIAKLEYSSLSQDTPVSQSVDLSTSQNPLRIRFKARLPVDANLPPLRVPVKVVITDAEGTLLSATLSFSTNGVSTGPEQGSVSGSQPIEFNVLNNGPHVLYLSIAPNGNNGGIADPDIGTVTATVLANAPALNDDHKAIAAALALAGIYLLLRSGRGRRKKADSGPKMRWGRGSDRND